MPHTPEEIEYLTLLEQQEQKPVNSASIAPRKAPELLTLEHALRATAKSIIPAPELLHKIVRAAESPAPSITLSARLRHMFKTIGMIGTLAAACAIAVVLHMSSNPPTLSVSNNSTPSAALNAETQLAEHAAGHEPTPIATEESIDTILSALDMWDTQEKETVATTDSSAFTPDIATEEQAINSFDTEANAYAQEL